VRRLLRWLLACDIVAWGERINQEWEVDPPRLVLGPSNAEGARTFIPASHPAAPSRPQIAPSPPDGSTAPDGPRVS